MEVEVASEEVDESTDMSRMRGGGEKLRRIEEGSPVPPEGSLPSTLLLRLRLPLFFFSHSLRLTESGTRT